MTDGGARKPGITLLRTANDPDEAAEWQKLLIEAGIHAIVRGHRESGSTERRPAFSGVDVYVPSTRLTRAREIIAPVAASGQLLTVDERPFPWVWLFVVPVALLVATVVLIFALA